MPRDALTNNFGLVSALYIYTNTPPHGYGTQVPIVAETALRTMEYNRKPSNKVLKIDEWELAAIDQCVEEVINRCMYGRMYEFFELNTGMKSQSYIEWIQAFFKWLSKESITCRKIECSFIYKIKYNRETKQRRVTAIKRKRILKLTIKGNEKVRGKGMDQARSFASYIKHKQRGKKDRRAIESANMNDVLIH